MNTQALKNAILRRLPNYKASAQLVGAPFYSARTKFRWTENHEAQGFRFVGFVDQILESRAYQHLGYYAEAGDMPETTYRAAVFQLPARGGKPQFYAAYVSSNDARTGLGRRDNWIFRAAAIAVGHPAYDTKEEAAHAADAMTERVAEVDREHDEAWHAGNECAQIEEERAFAWSQLKTLARERKEAREAVDGKQWPALCAMLNEKAARLWDQITDAREKIEDLISTHRTYHADAFNDGRSSY